MSIISLKAILGIQSYKNPIDDNIIEHLSNPVSIAEIAIEKGATGLLMPVSRRRQVSDLPDEMATKIAILLYSDAQDNY